MRAQPLIDTAGPDPHASVEAVRLAVGRIVGTHGIKGELKLRLLTDAPEHLATVKRVFVGDEPNPRRLVSFRFHGDEALIRLAGITTPEAGAEVRGQIVRIAGSDAQPLAEGEFFLYQLIGLTAETEAGERLGFVIDLIETGANDVLVIRPEGGGVDLLLPNHPDVVLAIEPAAGRIVVRPLEFYGE